MVLIRHWGLMKFTERSALVIVHLRSRFANTLQRFLFKTVDPTYSKNFIIYLVESHATVVQTEYEANLPCAVRAIINRSEGICV